MDIKAVTRMVAKHQLVTVTLVLDATEARQLHEGLCMLSTYILARDAVRATAGRLKSQLWEAIEDCV